MSLRKLSHLKRYRQERRLSQEEVYKLSGVSRSTIAELETGRRRARPGTVRKLAKALKIKPQDLT